MRWDFRWQDGKMADGELCLPARPQLRPRLAGVVTSAHTGANYLFSPPPTSWIRFCSLTASVLSLCASPGILWLSLLGKVGLGPTHLREMALGQLVLCLSLL